MGSGMLPCGAYVTLEHEYILIFRKSGKRNFKHDHEKKIRYESAFFWEERNTWFSDIWFDIKGTNQYLVQNGNRKRSGAYPFELAYRIINMYSIKGDMIFDPFLGTGTTVLAAITSARNSIGIELDNALREVILNRIKSEYKKVNRRIIDRIQQHTDFIHRYEKEKRKLKHINRNYNFPVMTKQEEYIVFDFVNNLEIQNGDIVINYSFTIDETESS
jgi:DNA modification methylase